MLPVDPARYALFCGLMAVFAISPGPANFFMIATGVRAGARHILLGVAGLNTATMVWVAFAALGIGALTAAFPFAFGLIAIAGGLYVAWLGSKAIWSAAKASDNPLAAIQGAAPGQAFRAGFAVQIANPKAVVFFSAILPPFIDPSRPPLMQFAWLGATTIWMDVIAMTAYGLAGRALAATLQSRRAARLFSAVTGILLLSAAALILLGH